MLVTLQLFGVIPVIKVDSPQVFGYNIGGYIGLPWSIFTPFSGDVLHWKGRPYSPHP
jgi:hypothetical protein